MKKAVCALLVLVVVLTMAVPAMASNMEVLFTADSSAKVGGHLEIDFNAMLLDGRVTSDIYNAILEKITKFIGIEAALSTPPSRRSSLAIPMPTFPSAWRCASTRIRPAPSCGKPSIAKSSRSSPAPLPWCFVPLPSTMAQWACTTALSLRPVTRVLSSHSIAVLLPTV